MQMLPRSVERGDFATLGMKISSNKVQDLNGLLRQFIKHSLKKRKKASIQLVGMGKMIRAILYQAEFIFIKWNMVINIPALRR